MKPNKDALVYLLNLANDMRRAKGDNEIYALPGSTRHHPYDCIIANAFNYGCAVYPTLGIFFQEEKDALTYCKVMDISPDNVKFIECDSKRPEDMDDNNYNPTAYDGRGPDLPWKAPLTNELEMIAKWFDNRTIHG